MWTDRELKALQPKDKSYFSVELIRQRGVGRLAVKVSPSGNKSFYYRYTLDGKYKFVGLGPYKSSAKEHGITLKQARERFAELSDIYQTHGDVQAHLFAEKESARLAAIENRMIGTLDDLYEAYLIDLKARGKASCDKYRANYRRWLVVHSPHLPSKAARDITVDDIFNLISWMINEKGITSGSNDMRKNLHAAFQFGLRHDNDPRMRLEREVKFGLTFNPVTAIPVQKDFNRVGTRHLSEEELGKLWRAIPLDFGVSPGRLIRLCLALGGQRPYEIAHTPWSCYDFKENLVIVPAEISKNRKPHLIPLASLALRELEFLKEIHGDSEYPIIGRVNNKRDGSKPLTSTTISRSIKRFIDAPGSDFEKFIPRDLRRTVKTLAGKAGISKEMRDRLQNHSLNDVSSKHYDRYDYVKEKRESMEVWDTYLQNVIQQSG